MVMIGTCGFVAIERILQSGVQSRVKGWGFSHDASALSITVERPDASQFGSSSKGIVVRFQMAFGAIPSSSQQAEVPTELAVKRFGVIAHHVEPAAFRRAFCAKCTDNHAAAWLHGAGNLLDVGKTVLRRRKEMENRSIMPEVVGMWLQLAFQDIADQPTHLLRSQTQSVPRNFDRSRRDVEYGEIFVPAKKQVVNQC